MNRANKTTTVGIIVIVGMILFFLRRRHRKRSEQYINGQDWLNDAERRPPAGKPSVLGSLASKIPLLGGSLGSRGWGNLGDHGADTFDEKRAMTSASAAHTGVGTGAIAVETSFSRTSHVDMSKVADAPIPPIPTHIFHAAKSSMLSPSGEPSYSLAMQSAMANRDTASRGSDMSSLSSGFADSDIVVPPAVARKQRRSSQVSSLSGEVETNTLRYSGVSSISISDEMSLRPVTMISEVSTETAPRFRTVDSWVNHQNARGSRPGTRGGRDAPALPRAPPPEQEYNLMMSDDEEPRRVEGQPPKIGRAM